MSQYIEDIFSRARRDGELSLTLEEQTILNYTLLFSVKVNKDAADGLCGPEAQAAELAKMEADFKVVLELVERIKAMGFLSGPALPPSPPGAASGMDLRSLGEPGRKMIEAMLPVQEKMGMDQATLEMVREAIRADRAAAAARLTATKSLVS